MPYFSEREEGEQPRENEEIGKHVRDGIQALVDARKWKEHVPSLFQ